MNGEKESLVAAPRAREQVKRPSQFAARCPVCGHEGTFASQGKALRGDYPCQECGGVLRYQAQAALLVNLLSREGARSLVDLAREEHFRALRIYEPGSFGPFRKILVSVPHYETSVYRLDVLEGQYRYSVRCENLMHLTYADESFDLIITSDIFEHVRKPFEGFAEVGRVLRPGGRHVFSIPVSYPMAERSVERVDTSGAEDVSLMEPVYHSGGKHIVYTDFGSDLINRLGQMGTPTEAVRFETEIPGLDRVITFHSVKPH